jgi:hypothetical protein
MEKLKSIVMQIDEMTHQALKVKAAQERCTIRELVTEYIQNGLAAKRAKPCTEGACTKDVVQGTEFCPLHQEEASV